jgi:hypothetical protein
MAKSKATFMKKELEKKKQLKKNNKIARKEERQQNGGSGDLDSMLAYVNEHGEIVSGVAPEKALVLEIN